MAKVSRKKNANKEKKLKIIPLGGVGEIGKNMTVFEYGNDIIVIDCGIAFPREELLGIDYVMPDISYLEENKDKIRAFVLTHGHEDHIGAASYVFPNFDVPVYGTRLTVALIKNKLEENGIDCVKLATVKPGDVIKAGVFSVEFIHVCHSIDDSSALAIKTPLGTVIHTGDFKIDYTPTDGKIIDIRRFAEYGAEGVLALMSDSTNAEEQGVNLTEKEVANTFENYFDKAKGRIIITTFASNIHRLQQVIDRAKKYNRKICFVGRSIEKISELAIELGYLNMPKTMLVDISELSSLKDNKIVIITTGSQGESMSGLSRIANGEHPSISIKSGDLVIISASAIPGNEVYINNVVNELARKGATVIDEGKAKVHVSGHACQEELKLMMTITKPKYFIPVHGEYRHLQMHASLASEIGISNKNIFIPEIGKVIEITEKEAKSEESVTSGVTLIDGLGVGDIGTSVLKERKQLSEDGLVIAVAYLPRRYKDRKLIDCDIITRGFVYVKDAEELITGSKDVIYDTLINCMEAGVSDQIAIKNKLKRNLQNYLYKIIKRSPMIIPVIVNTAKE